MCPPKRNETRRRPISISSSSAAFRCESFEISINVNTSDKIRIFYIIESLQSPISIIRNVSPFSLCIMLGSSAARHVRSHRINIIYFQTLKFSLHFVPIFVFIAIFIPLFSSSRSLSFRVLRIIKSSVVVSFRMWLNTTANTVNTFALIITVIALRRYGKRAHDARNQNKSQRKTKAKCLRVAERASLHTSGAYTRIQYTHSARRVRERRKRFKVAIGLRNSFAREHQMDIISQPAKNIIKKIS